VATSNWCLLTVLRAPCASSFLTFLMCVFADLLFLSAVQGRRVPENNHLRALLPVSVLPTCLPAPVCWKKSGRKAVRQDTHPPRMQGQPSLSDHPTASLLTG